jgi:hypothetical protein
MNYFKDLDYSNFIELIDYLNSISDNNAISVIGSFFPSLTAVQELEMSYIIDSRDERAFEKFKIDYPDLEVDVEGKSEPSRKDYWEITERSLNYTYELAFSNLKSNNFRDESLNRGNTQIYNAKTLAVLKNMNAEDDRAYFMRRKLFLDKGENYIVSQEKFNKIEKIISELGLDSSKFMVYVLNHIKEKKFENYRLFLEHLFKRIELLSLDKDLKSASNKDFVDNIKTVINKNN